MEYKITPREMKEARRNLFYSFAFGTLLSLVSVGLTELDNKYFQIGDRLNNYVIEGRIEYKLKW